MYVVKLCKGLSFSGFIHATVENPWVKLETVAEANMAVETGYFCISAAPTPEEGIQNMTKAQLEQMASEHNVDLMGCKNNMERVERIQKALSTDTDGMKIAME